MLTSMAWCCVILIVQVQELLDEAEYILKKGGSADDIVRLRGHLASAKAAAEKTSKAALAQRCSKAVIALRDMYNSM